MSKAPRVLVLGGAGGLLGAGLCKVLEKAGREVERTGRPGREVFEPGALEALLDRVYQHDMGLMDEVQTLAEAIERLPARGGELGVALPELLNQIDNVETQWSARVEMLKGLE